MTKTLRLVAPGVALAMALAGAAGARPSDQKCDASQRDARGRCPATPGPGSKAGKGARPPVTARPAWREHQTPAFAEVDLTAALARPASNALRPDPAARKAVPRPDLGVQVDDAMISEYQRGSETLPDSDPDKPSYLLKLADAQAARYRKARQAGASSKPAADAALVLAVKAYSAVTSNPAFARFARLDEALGRLAVLLEDSGQQDNALLAYRRLVKEFPRARHIADAVLALSDQALLQGRLDEAEAGYGKLASVTSSPAHAYVRYMTGWVLLNRDRPRDALTAFTEAADEAARLKQPALVRAARQDGVRAFAQFGSASEALQRFAATPALLPRVGEAYMDMGKFDQAITLYQAMIATQPRSPELCTWGLAVTRASLGMPTIDQRARAVTTFVELLRHVRKAKLAPAAALARCQAEGEELVRTMAQAFHQEGARTLNARVLGVARQLYEAYFSADFALAAHAATMRYYYAELLWSRAEREPNPRIADEFWSEAALAFSAAARTPGLAPDLVKEASYAAVLGWRKAIDHDARPGKVSDANDGGDGKGPVMRGLPPRTAQMLSAFKAYLAITRDPGESASLSFLAGSLYARYGHVLEAAKVLARVVTTWPDDEVAEHAASILLDVLNQARRYDELVGWVRTLRSEPQYAGLRARMGETLERLHAQIRRKEAEGLEAKGDFEGCAISYLAIAREVPDYDQLDEVLYNAIACYKRGGANDKAQGLVDTLGKLAPRSPLLARAKELLSR
ncbi:MAG: tetratricopeptide repeat protein [Deltaproteobacteria bacterium]|nr:tetratricopeptide repeat protein [Deltaproteobacteria bacterium]